MTIYAAPAVVRTGLACTNLSCALIKVALLRKAGQERMNEGLKTRKNLIFAEWGGGAPMELRPERSGGLSGYTVL